MTYKEALLVVVGIDKPTCYAVRSVADHFAGLWLKDVYSVDLDSYLAIGVIVRELGPGIFDQISSHFIDRALTTYRTVVSGLINDRITELNTGGQQRQPNEISDSFTDQLSTPLPTSTPLPDGLVTINETAAYLRVTRVTVERLIKSGALEGTHVARRHFVTRKSIDEYLAIT